MDTIIFDGRKFAEEEEKQLSDQIVMFTKSLGRPPKLVSILVGDDPASKLYVGLKQKVAERIGMEFQLARFEAGDLAPMNRFIGAKNGDKSVDGILVQLPVPGLSGVSLQRILDNIAPEKDVDGQRSESKFLPATVRAVFAILEEALAAIGLTGPRPVTLVVGNKGTVGVSLERELSKLGYQVIGMDKKDFDPEKLREAEVVISCTGQVGLITGEMVKQGVIAIDVGSPKGDFEFESVVKKASFITPVPGGVGPVTVAMLFANLVDSIK